VLLGRFGKDFNLFEVSTDVRADTALVTPTELLAAVAQIRRALHGVPASDV
jgi:hypothetical protein